MPRRSGGGMRSVSPTRAPVPTRSAVPSTVIVTPAPRQPGLFGQMAATAGGVAVGSAVGHTLGAAITGGFHGHDQSVAAAAPSPTPQTGPSNQQLYDSDRCYLYQKEFMKCLDAANGDSSKCQGFWDALKDCQQRQQTSISSL